MQPNTQHSEVNMVSTNSLRGIVLLYFSNMVEDMLPCQDYFFK